MSTEGTHRGIVVGVDGSAASAAAVEWAARDAELRGLPLRIVYVVAPVVETAIGWSEFPTAAFLQFQEDYAHQTLEQAYKIACEATTASRASEVTGEVLHGPVVPSLADLSRHADMIVVGCRGEGAVVGALLGSVSSGLVHHAYCPVGVIHDEDASAAPAEAPVVVGIDGSPTSELATEIAFVEASRRGVNLIAVHAWTDMGALDFPSVNWSPIEWRNIRDREQTRLSEWLSVWRGRYPNVGVHEIVVSDRPAPRLLDQAQRAQLIVVGSLGRGGFPGMFLGSVGRAVVHSARIPVIVARIPQQDENVGPQHD